MNNGHSAASVATVDGPVEFSPEALEAFRAKVRRAGGPVRAIRLGVHGSGCNGFQYAIEFDYGPVRAGDVQWNPPGWNEFGYDLQLTEGNRLYLVWFRVDKKSALLLSGSRVTHTKTLMKQGF